MTLNRLFLFAVAIVCTMQLWAQKAPMKYGKIDEADLNMTVYDRDSSAVAVVLCHYGVFDSDKFQFSETIRVKILKETGTKFGTQVFAASREDVVVRGRTYNMVGGVLQEDKLQSESIFKERIFEDYYRLRIAMPNVKVGSIIDIEVSYNGFPNEWRFQDHIPVRYSEVILNPSPYLEYSKNFFGFEPFSESNSYRWVCKNLPAFKDEAYMSSVENYINKMEFDIKSISYPGYFKDYTTSWDDINKLLLESDYFGTPLGNGCTFLNEIADQIKQENISDLSKMQKAFEAIKQVKWNNRPRLLTSSNVLSRPFNEKAGNSADINLMLVKLLRKLDFKAYPVVLSTRENGIISRIQPSLNRLNYTICLVMNGEQRLLLDATEKYIPFGLLPERVLNYNGRIVDGTFVDWVELKAPSKEKELFSYELSFDDQLQLQGTMTNMYSDYSAYYFRKNYFSFANKDEYIIDAEKDNPGLKIENLEIENLDSISKPIVEKYQIKVTNKALVLDSVLIINPLMFDQISENPFKLDERKFPVDFATGHSTNFLCKIKIPTGYIVNELPKPAKIKMPNDDIMFVISYLANANELTINYRFNINKTVFNEDEYGLIKEFYNSLINKHAEPIVLKKL